MARTLDKLMAQREQLEARIKAAKQRESAKERKQDTRRKVLLGAYLLERMKRDPKLEKEVLGHLTEYLTRNVDRAIFNLEPLQSEDPTSKDVPPTTGATGGVPEVSTPTPGPSPKGIGRAKEGPGATPP